MWWLPADGHNICWATLQKAIIDLSNKAPVMLCLSLAVFPSPKLSTRCVAVSGSACYEGGMCGGKGAKACTTNSAHERLMQREQLSSIVSLQISSVPHFAAQCVSSKRAGERENRVETNQKEEGKKKTKKTSEGKEPNIKMYIALTRCRLSSVSSI